MLSGKKEVEKKENYFAHESNLGAWADECQALISMASLWHYFFLSSDWLVVWVEDFIDNEFFSFQVRSWS